jgi:hypothetical protein
MEIGHCEQKSANGQYGNYVLVVWVNQCYDAGQYQSYSNVNRPFDWLAKAKVNRNI